MYARCPSLLLRGLMNDLHFVRVYERFLSRLAYGQFLVVYLSLASKGNQIHPRLELACR